MGSARADLELRRWREEWRQIQAAEEEKQWAPVRAAEENLKATAMELGKLERDCIASGKDPAAFVDPQTIGPEHAMSFEAARQFNAQEAEKFVHANPWFYQCDENKAAVIAYLERNGITICTAAMYQRAAERLRDFGLLMERPPDPEPAAVEPLRQQTEPVVAQEPEPQSYEGVDPQTGTPRTYTKREVDAMSSDEFRRAFKLYGDNRPVFVDARS